MKILVNICPLKQPLTGIGNYVLYLLQEILDDQRIEDVVGICHHRFYSRQQLQAKITALLTENIKMPSTTQGRHFQQSVIGLIKKIPKVYLLRLALHNSVLALHWFRYRDYIYWGGNYILPLLPFKRVVTVHDLSHIHYPACHTQQTVDYLNNVLAKMLQRAATVMVVSSATAQDVKKHFTAVHSKPLVVVNPAIDHQFRPHSQQEQHAICSKYCLPKKYILALGTLEPRKNLLNVLAAYERLPVHTRNKYALVLVGHSGWKSADLLQKIHIMEQRGELYCLGYVPAIDLPALYSAAEVFIYASLFEGFGMPVLEAMASNTAVITSNCSAMPEVTGGTALLVDPHKIESIAQGLQRLLNDKSLRNNNCYAAYQRSKQFHWKKSYQALYSVLNNIKVSTT
jgi:alpha-1,3-rhamnosyl/mannosyltransferase